MSQVFRSRPSPRQRGVIKVDLESMDVIRQEIHVAFRYPVYFTTGVFTASNRLVRDLVQSDGRDTPAKVVVVVDRGVERAHPDLTAAIERYGLEHEDALTLGAPVLVIPGGEQVKNDARHMERVLETINAA